MAHGDADAGQLTPRSTFYDRGRFGRLFPTLPPFSADVPLIRDALSELGAPGGPMDAQDDLSDPVTLITDPAKSAHNPNNPTLTAGFTFLGQFLDHDMTFDPTSSLARAQDPESIRNFRIPALDLDSVYGGGPAVSPYLYDQNVDEGRTTFLTEEIPGSAAVSIDGNARRDLPRNSQSVALIADPRNDENMMVAGLQQAMLRFHNQVYLDVAADLGTAYTVDETFAEAQRVVRWHYQWMVLHEFLPRTVGQTTAQDVLDNGLKFFIWRNDPYIPVEFSVGAYRFGHSQVRPSYRANFGTSTTDLTQQFFALLFKPTATNQADPDDLRGGRHRHHAVVGAVRPAGPSPGSPTSLATRNLLRNLTMEVPSGQSIASAMSLPPIAPGDLSDLQPLSLHNRTPLWFYILREAQVTANGEHLGPVGGRIVAEVIYGLIQGDSQSYLGQDPEWTPTYGTNGTFTIVDLLTKSGTVATLT